MRNNIKKTILIGDIGINHNGDLNIAKKLIDVAKECGLDYVKFQKRTPELCVPDKYKDVPRDTPWGVISYLDYRHKTEFNTAHYLEIDRYCKKVGQKWFVSIWDKPSLDMAEQFDNDYIKIPSALITDIDLLHDVSNSWSPAILSTGGSNLTMVDKAVDAVGDRLACVMHCTSTYPCKPSEINLNCIRVYKDRYRTPVGFSNHFPGIPPILGAVALGARAIEFHITLSRSMWGTDQAASFEKEGIAKIVKYTESLNDMMGDGIKRFYESEIPVMEKLRR